MASHTQLKIRTGSQVVDRKKALRESLLKLEQAEKSHSIGKRSVSQKVEEEGRLKLLTQTAEVDDEAIQKKYDDKDADDDDNSAGSGGWSDVDNKDGDGDDLDASSDESEDDSDDEDEEAALQAELAKIRAEREATKRQQDEAEAAVEESKLEEAALLGNPLLAATDADTTSGGRLKRRWNEDVVFRNQAKGEPKVQKRFINDTVRNDFHKRFLHKFIR
jgi:protein CWC15